MSYRMDQCLAIPASQCNSYNGCGECPACEDVPERKEADCAGTCSDCQCGEGDEVAYASVAGKPCGAAWTISLGDVKVDGVKFHGVQFDGAKTTQELTAEANANGVGFKADAEKPDWSLLDLAVEEDVVRVLTAGARKYAPDNWRKVPGARARYFAAALRHLALWQSGEVMDQETGLPHLAHAACCLHFLAWFDRNGVAK